MQKIKSEKGITAVVLVITMIIIAIISVPIAVKTAHLQQTKKFTNLRNDITELEETINTLYGSDGDISKIGPYYSTNTTGQPAFLSRSQGANQYVMNSNDNSFYRIIDAKKLERDLSNSMFNITLNKLNYGANCYKLEDGYSTSEVYTGDKTDVYIINVQSKTIYYPDGIKYGDYTYYRLPETFSSVSLGNN